MEQSVPTSTADKSVFRFADATCQRLLALVLNQPPCGGVSAAATENVPAEQFAQRTLEALQRRDTEFAAWRASLPSSGTKSGALPAEQLAGTLVHFPSWLPADVEACGPAALLHAACHQALRLSVLERRFLAELERRQTDALYHLAYGLSHEFNNPLAIIASRAGTLAASEERKDRQEILQLIVDTAMRGGEMLGDLMLIARPPQLQTAPLAIGPFTENFVADARRWASARAIVVDYTSSCQASVEADASALREALWCLVRNAIEAMPEGGPIEVALEPREERVVWSITDQGSGLSPEASRHAFDAFYSGREAGRGLGVGLTKAKRLIELHGGFVKLYNRPTCGVTAEVTLPVTSGAAPGSDEGSPAT